MSAPYPKIETLYQRGADFKVIPGLYRKPEFGLLRKWHITEKIDGTNIRVTLWPDIAHPDYMERHVHIRGRTNSSYVPAFLGKKLHEMFTVENTWDVFHAEDKPGESPFTVTLYGEGYGPRIQKIGSRYREGDTVNFRLFDVQVGDKFLDWPNVRNVAGKLGISTVPEFGELYTTEVDEMVRSGFLSQVPIVEGGDRMLKAEGVVARTIPYIYDWRGNRVMWKLKGKDFA